MTPTVQTVSSRARRLAFAALLLVTGPATALAQDPPKTDDAVDEGWKREGLGFKKGGFHIKLKGYAQYDLRSFDWEVQETDLGTLRSPEHEWRRTRIGVEGEWGDWAWEFVVDPRLEYPDEALKDAVLTYKASKKLRLDAGHMKPPSSVDFLTSAGKTDMIERNYPGSRMTPDREWGVTASGEASRYTYALGVFAGDGAFATTRSEVAVAARATAEIRKRWLVGATYMQAEVEAEPRVGNREPSPKGVQARTPSGFVFWERAHVNGTRRRMGGELSFTKGPFRLIGEAMELREQRKGQGSTGQDIPDARARGWSVTASWLVTGEKKEDTIEPEKSLFRGGVGAIELEARAEGMKVDDVGDSSGFAGYGNRARNIAPSGARTLSAGLSWWLHSSFRLQGNVQADTYNDPLIAPQPGRTGTYVTLVARIQVLLP